MSGLSPSDMQLVRATADRLALRRLVEQYSRAVDRRDFGLLAELYWDDATEEHGDMFRGSAADYITWVQGALAMNEITVHYVVNALFELDGDYAEGEVYKINYHRLKGATPTEVTTGSRSHDRYARRNGVWKFLYRGVVLDWAESRPVDPAAYATFAANSPMGRTDATDLSYQRLRLFGRSAAG